MIYLRTFIVGFLTIAMMHVLVTCSDNDGGTQPPDVPVVDVTAIHDGAAKVEAAFRTADPEEVFNVLTEEAQVFYIEDLFEIEDQMAAFADAIASRRLTVFTECYAEYEFDVEGVTMTFAMAAQDENDWKRMRF
jgi:capsid portal protein